MDLRSGRCGVARSYMTLGLELIRSQILAFRHRAAALDERLPRDQGALRRAAWAGLQDSMPRAALLSIHARMAGTEPETWEDPSLVQVWGPRFSAYVVAKCDRAVFTLGRLPSEAGPRKRAQDIAARLQLALAGRRMTQGTAARAMGATHANQLRYAAPTGTVVIRWDGSHQPDVWNVPAPDIDPHEARLELARRAAIPGSYCTAPTANSWCPTRVNAARCGHRVSGRAPCSSKERRSAFGDARGMCSRFSHGNVFPPHSAMRSKRRRGHCPCPGLPNP
jgi:hypothetical protein